MGSRPMRIETGLSICGQVKLYSFTVIAMVYFARLSQGEPFTESWFGLDTTGVPDNNTWDGLGDLLGVGGLTWEDWDNPEKALVQDLLQAYTYITRPVQNASSVVTVRFGVCLNQLLDLDERNQILSTALWIYEEWFDESLQWDPADYNNLSRVIIPPDRIWVPDIYIFNTASGHEDGFVNVTPSKVIAEYTGKLRWNVPLMVKSSCSVDVRYFPYDQQRCSVRFGSWIYDAQQMDLVAVSSKPDLATYVTNSEFELMETSLIRRLLDGSQCPGERPQPLVSLNLTFKRRSKYYDYIVVTPTLLLCLLTLVSYLLPSHRGEKVSIGLTVVLTLYFLQLLIAENIPVSNTPPLLGLLLFAVMSMNGISLIVATLVMNLKKQGDERICTRVPAWILCICRGVTCLCKSPLANPIGSIRFRSRRQRPPVRRRQLNPRSARETMESSNGHSVSKRLPETSVPEGNGKVDFETSSATEKEHMLTENGTDSQKPIADQFGIFRKENGEIVNTEEERLNNDGTNKAAVFRRRCLTRKPTLRYPYRRPHVRQWRDTVPYEVRQQWYFVADVVDRCAFVVSLIAMVIMLTTMMCILPQLSYPEHKDPIDGPVQVTN